MKTSMITVAALTGLMSVVSGFSVTNCNSGAYHNYGDSGNNKCQSFNTGSSVKYDSNMGCQLQVYPSSGCEGTPKIFTTQDTCQDVGFIGVSVKATDC
ncbi:hypothetical protein CHU98_g11348 [Xylaria longipes]|nr:hypothetical protein CHU98_g11348 [Xylaria longipes]